MENIKKYWSKVALALILILTGFLNFYAIGQEGYGNQYYAAAVKSMLTSWHNFFFASFDPGGYVTVDKPALGLWLQAISAYIFGFHGWSIILPEALSAVLSVAILYFIVKRFFGKTAGIIASLVLSLTPIFIAVSRTNNLDSSLVMVLLLATWILILAAEKGSLKLLLLSMAIVGLGFNIKMLEAFMVLPALYLVYMLTANAKISKRVIHLVAATVVLLGVSLSWAEIVDLTPADERPYIGSSQTNSVAELALGYNGLQRITGRQGNNGVGNSRAGGNPTGNNAQANIQVPPNGQNPQNENPQAPGNGTVAQLPTNNENVQDARQRPSSSEMQRGVDGGNRAQAGIGGEPSGQPDGGGNGGGPGGTSENGQKGIFRIFNQQLSGQISWMFPMAIFGILILTLKAFNKETKDRKTLLRNLLLWGAWIVPMIGYFSIAGFYHRYYLTMLAPGIAALAGIGIVELWKAYLESGWKWTLLPVALMSNAALQSYILWNYTQWRSFLIPIICVVCLFTAAGLIIIRIMKRDIMGNTIKVTIATGFAALLIAPAIWAYTPIMYGSQTSLPVAGPELKKGGDSGQNNPGKSVAAKSSGNSSSSTLVKFLLSKKQNEKYLIAVANANSAASIIIETGEPVMAVGGFSGSDEILTVTRLEQMVKDGEIRYFQISGRGMGQQSEISNWVTSHGKEVTLDNGNSSNTTISRGGQFDNWMGSGTLYDLAPEKDIK